jgi:hypothetical protein
MKNCSVNTTVPVPSQNSENLAYSHTKHALFPSTTVRFINLRVYNYCHYRRWNKITNSMVQDLSSEVRNLSAQVIPRFHENRASLRCSEKPVICSYPEPLQSSPHRQTHFSNIHFNIILHLYQGIPYGVLPLGFPTKIL